MTNERQQWIELFNSVGLNFEAIMRHETNSFSQDLTREQWDILDSFGICGE